MKPRPQRKRCSRTGRFRLAQRLDAKGKRVLCFWCGRSFETCCADNE